MESRLITPELEKRLAEYPLGSQDGKGKSAMCVAVFHIGRIRWYVLEGGREGSDYTIFCIACGMAETEYGYASVREMEAIEVDGGKFGIPMKFKVENLHRYTPESGTRVIPNVLKISSDKNQKMADVPNSFPRF